MSRLRRSLSSSVPVLALLVAFAVALPASADWIVLRGGKRIETKGPWVEHANKMITFTEMDGHRSSVLLSLVDTAATQAANGGKGHKGVKAASDGSGKTVISDDNTKKVDEKTALAIARDKQDEESRNRQRESYAKKTEEANKPGKKQADCRAKYPNDDKARSQCING